MKNTQNTDINTDESMHNEMGPVWQNPIQNCKNCSSKSINQSSNQNPVSDRNSDSSQPRNSEVNKCDKKSRQDIVSGIITLPSNTSGAIQAALPLLLVMWVWASHAVPKSQIFRTVPPLISSKLKHPSNTLLSVELKVKVKVNVDLYRASSWTHL